ncbi:hypothetical protein WDQ52_004513 [Salmonella enterica]|nr:hypothetical protein [Salmonella enterica subsp. enterica serovar Newport]
MIKPERPASLTGTPFRKEEIMSEIKVKLLALIFLCPTLACSAQNFNPDFVKHVFLNLDMTSFPNSTAAQGYPPNIITMKDSFKVRKEYKVRKCSSNNCMEVFFPFPEDSISPYDIKSPGWVYKLKILYINSDEIMACFSDYCDSAYCSYMVNQPLKIKKEHDKYIVIADYEHGIKGCDFYKR